MPLDINTDNNTASNIETIAALATPPGKGGVGIIRISGPLVPQLALSLIKQLPQPRYALFTDFYTQEGQTLDQGLALYFKAPYSFTGEDVLELQGHGGPIILDLLLAEVIRLGARLAKPGEFSERAFLNNKLDLAQAEAIADLIDATSSQAALGALRSLQGEFSKQINQLVEEITNLRIYVEAAIDFPEEEIDFLTDGKCLETLEDLEDKLTHLLATANQGSLLQEGKKLVILGKPNAGKSSLLNALAGQDKALVTAIAGTTRDLVSTSLNLQGLPVEVIDTAGLRATDDEVEQLGIAKAWQQIHQADWLLILVDAQQESLTAEEAIQEFIQTSQPSAENLAALKVFIEQQKFTLVRNKLDLTQLTTGVQADKSVNISAKQRLGLDELTAQLTQSLGYLATTEGTFTARRRHLTALEVALNALNNAKNTLVHLAAGELVAEDLRLAQEALGEITGKLTSDDLLGKIFSSFCIGK